MQVEKLKYTIWAADAGRAAKFYQDVFGATITGQNPHITELSVIAAGGKCERKPKSENGEPPHLAMCEDTDGNQFMVSRKRG